MTISALIKKGGLAKAATATTATIATQEAGSDATVAEVATVTVAHTQGRKVQTAASLPERFQQEIAGACYGLSITPAELYGALAPEDIEEWRKGDINADTVAAFARSLMRRMEMEQGRAPVHYTERAICKQCGPVWMWFSGEVEGCPWCWNRAAGRKIPNPII